MAKYMILYSSTLSAKDLMANANPEDMKASMDEWREWKDEATKSAGFEFGLPLQAVGQVTPDDVSDSSSLISGYSIMECDSKDTLMELLKTHPHLKRAGASIDVLEMIPMPGM